MVVRVHEPTFAELFTPKLLTVLREHYRWRDLRADIVAGLTVAIVALPLSMAIAVACGVTPERGLYTAIVGGFFVSALGGSRFQIGGPAGAFIVLISVTVAQHGIDGVILATFLSGLILLAVGFLRLGTFIKYIPYPVTVGFTSGIAVIISRARSRSFSVSACRIKNRDRLSRNSKRLPRRCQRSTLRRWRSPRLPWALF